MVLAAPILVSIPRDQGWLATNSKAPALLLQIVTPSPLCSPQDKSMNPRGSVGIRKGLYSGDKEDSGCSQNIHLLWTWMPGSFMDQMGGEVRKQIQKAIQSL